jgi:hypothetical protein
MSTICSIFLNRPISAIKIDDSVKNRTHQVFGVSYFVFRLTDMMFFQIVKLSNTKHKTPNTKP